MSIEFSCPQCQQLVRTPDSVAGKKGRCPNCGAIVLIPHPTASRSRLHAARSGDRPASGSSAGSSLSGSSLSGSSLSAAGAQPPRRDSELNVPAEVVEFTCAKCGEVVRAPARAAGKKGKCPRCQTLTQIPELPKARGSQIPEQPSATSRAPTVSPSHRTPSRAWKTPSPSDETLEEMPDLTPAEPGAPPSLIHDLWDDVVPVAAGAGLAPIPDPLLGDGPASGHTLAASPFAPGATIRPARSLSIVNDAGRRGLSWEREPSLDAFWDTISEVLSGPHAAFARMRRGDGIANPLMFLVVSFVIGHAIVLIEGLIFGAIYLLLVEHGTFGGPKVQISWERFFLAFGGVAIVQIMGVTAGAAIGGFISAALYHVALLIVGGARAGYEATYRVVAFGLGSAYMLSAIPIVGPIFSAVMQIIVLTYGFREAHETTTGRAFFAVFLPIFFALCLCGFLIALNPAVLTLLRQQAH